jgi:hypothetical protein
VSLYRRAMQQLARTPASFHAWSEPLMSRRRQQTAPENGGAQDTPGVGARARKEGLMRNWLGEGGAYKPKAKGRRAERESEGLIVPMKAVTSRWRERASLWSCL